jgi:gluconate kinase
LASHKTTNMATRMATIARPWLRSQFDALEAPGADENPIITVPIDAPPGEIAARIVPALKS